MLLLLRSKFIGVSKINNFEKLVQDKAKQLRQQYNLGNNCGRSIFDLIEKIETDGESPLLFRLPFENNELSGFVGYKNNRFAVYTNTNRTLGYEVFTAAHEIYHLIENIALIKENVVIEENETANNEMSEVAADIFAAELLMPEDDIIKEYKHLIKKSGTNVADETIIITLQQQYYVEYYAITKRLKKTEKIDFNNFHEQSLNRILNSENELYKLTKKLGYSNELNEPSRKKVYLPRTSLKIIEENYKNTDATLDDLAVLFSYCDLTPQDFGYEEEDLSENAKALEAKLRVELGE